MTRHLITNILLILFFGQILGANYEAGDQVDIRESQREDLYLAGSKVSINAVIYGDVIAGSGDVVINDSVHGDLLIGAGKASINSYVGDDIRISGGDISVHGVVEGDLIVFGGNVYLSESALINGDVIIYAGKVKIDGFINGDLLFAGGDFELNGDVGGNANLKAGEIKYNGKILGDLIISANEIEISDDARCQGSITYWSGNDVDFTKVGGPVTLDEDLALVNEDFNWGVFAGLLGLGLISYWIIFILSAFVVLLLLEHFLSKYFEQAATMLSSKFMLSFGYGMLYFIGVPVLILISFIVIIGFPIGVLMLSIYGVTLLFTASVSGLALAHFFKMKYKQNWSYSQTVAYALLSVVVLKVIFAIPILGYLLKRILGAAVYGSFILLMLKKKKED